MKIFEFIVLIQRNAGLKPQINIKFQRIYIENDEFLNGNNEFCIDNNRLSIGNDASRNDNNRPDDDNDE